MTVLNALKDNFMRAGYSTTNWGADTEIILDGTTTRRGIIAFNITGLSTVTSAVLSLYVSNRSAVADKGVVSRMLITDWTEGAGGWNPVVSNWNQYKASTNWNGGGCSGSGTDYTTTNAVSVSVPARYAWHNFNITNIWNDAVGAAQSTLSLVLNINDENWVSYWSRHYAVDPSLIPKITHDATSGWTHKIFGIAPGKVMTVAAANIKTIMTK